ncbi:hypothetical protein [Sphingomonas corticis]
MIANSIIPTSEIAADTQCQVCSCFSQNALTRRFGLAVFVVARGA